jgi:hypothetical protein
MQPIHLNQMYMDRLRLQHIQILDQVGHINKLILIMMLDIFKSLRSRNLILSQLIFIQK